jgi:hypothetical protein
MQHVTSQIAYVTVFTSHSRTVFHTLDWQIIMVGHNDHGGNLPHTLLFTVVAKKELQNTSKHSFLYCTGFDERR